MKNIADGNKHLWFLWAIVQYQMSCVHLVEANALNDIFLKIVCNLYNFWCLRLTLAFEQFVFQGIALFALLFYFVLCCTLHA